MIPRAAISAWRQNAPWPDDAQVERDLILTAALVGMFSEELIGKNLLLRGGTALHKLVLRPASRFSEDIDLVQVKAAPIGPVLTQIRNRLTGLLGKPKRFDKGDQISTLIYRFDSEIPPVVSMRLKLEINTREHLCLLGVEKMKLAVDNPWFRGEAEVPTYRLEELLATKLRALYQRKKGRDLYDLWLALEKQAVNAGQVVQCFKRYMAGTGRPVSRKQFESNLAKKMADPAFSGDLRPLLATGIHYDAVLAKEAVLKKLVSRLT